MQQKNKTKSTHFKQCDGTPKLPKGGFIQQYRQQMTLTSDTELEHRLLKGIPSEKATQ